MTPRSMPSQRAHAPGLSVLVCFAMLMSMGGCGSARKKKDDGPHPGAGRRVRAGAVWDDPARCAEAVRAGARLHRAQYRLRLGTWNLRWFPDGREDGGDRYRTDVGWVACILAWMDADVVALQEIRLTRDGRRSLDRMRAELKELSGTEWKVVTDSCPTPERQHLAILYRPDRVGLSQVANHPQTDPTTLPKVINPDCPGELWPTLATYVRSKQGGLDFHLATTQLEEGRDQKNLSHRQAGWRGLGEVITRRLALLPDEDVIVAADLSSSGCYRCTAPSPGAELGMLAETIGGFDRPLDSLACTPECTRFVWGKPQRTDHILVSRTMEEARGLSARAVGICDVAGCKKLGPDAALAFEKLSEHCPVIVDLNDRDDDPTIGAATVDELR